MPAACWRRHARTTLANSCRFATLPTVVVVNLVSSDRSQPTTKRVFGPLLLKLVNLRRNSLEDVLYDIRDILIGEIEFAAPVIDQWRIQSDESIPGRHFIALQTIQQAARG